MSGGKKKPHTRHDTAVSTGMPSLLILPVFDSVEQRLAILSCSYNLWISAQFVLTLSVLFSPHYERRSLFKKGIIGTGSNME